METSAQGIPIALCGSTQWVKRVGQVGIKTTWMVAQVQTLQLPKQDNLAVSLFKKEAWRLFYYDEDRIEASDAIEEEASD